MLGSSEAGFGIKLPEETLLRGSGHTNSEEAQKVELWVGDDLHVWEGQGEGNQRMTPEGKPAIWLPKGSYKIRIRISRRPQGENKWRPTHQVQAHEQEFCGYHWIVAVADDQEGNYSCIFTVAHFHRRNNRPRVWPTQIEVGPGETAYFYAYSLLQVPLQVKIANTLFTTRSRGALVPFKEVKGDQKTTNTTNEEFSLYADFGITGTSKFVRAIGPKLSRISNLAQYTQVGFWRFAPVAILVVRIWKPNG